MTRVPVIQVRGLTKEYLEEVGPLGQLALAFGGKPRSQARKLALNDVSFDVERGESLAIIGRNGSGKSTLLQIIAGTVLQTSGSARVEGRVQALLELGSGFSPEHTGRDNVILNGLLLGLSRKQILERFDEILSFSEIGEAVDHLVKTYSSGMVMRLAFAVQVVLAPEILIIDEALSVGDFFFQQKCIAKLKELQQLGTTLLFVSHDMHVVRDLCQRGLVLKAGRVEFIGDNLEAVERYLNDADIDIAHESVEVQVFDNTASHVSADVRWSGEDKLGGVLAVEGAPSVPSGDLLEIRVMVRGHARPFHILVGIENDAGQLLTAVGTQNQGLPLRLATEEAYWWTMRLKANIAPGEYRFWVSTGLRTGANTGLTISRSPDQSLTVDPSSFWTGDGMIKLPVTGALFEE